MKIKSFKHTAVKFKALQEYAIVIQTGTIDQCRDATINILNNPLFSTIGWQTSFTKLLKLINTNAPQFAIFSKGNSKLPFYCFSTLPGVTCPGAGDCINYCYSFKAWCYTANFCRQVQNAYLMRFNTAIIATAFKALKGSFDFRLYVDGDFANMSDVIFWMSIIKSTPQCKAYGYSKSFALLLTYEITDTWPTNYMLNISSGHNASPEMVKYVKALPITRGEFIAVNIGFKPIHGSKTTNDAIRSQFDEKIFPCPGQCGACTGKGHACGMPEMKHRIIAIAIH